MSHQHKCMSCGQSWDCPHPPADCKAGESVFPTLVLRGPNGPQVFDHICQRKPAVRPEERGITCPHGTVGYCEPCALRDPGELGDTPPNLVGPIPKAICPECERLWQPSPQKE